MKESIKIKGEERIQRNLSRLREPQITKAIRAGSKAIGFQIADELKEYPRRRYGAKMEFVSSKQRRYFFAALRSGEIQVPYTRTRDLGRSWNVRRRGKGAVVGNPSPYASLVQGQQSQTKMHKETGWITDREAVENVSKSGSIERIMVQAVEKQLEE